MRWEGVRPAHPDPGRRPAGPALRSMQVPLPAITGRWHAFFEDFLPFYVAAVAEAERAGPDPGHLGG